MRLAERFFGSRKRKNKVREAENIAEKKAARRQEWKLGLIHELAEAHSVQPDLNYEFDLTGPSEQRLQDLKRELIGREITMLRDQKLGTLRYCVESVIKDKIDGDFIETGVWKGGACIYLAGLLREYGEDHRKVFVADSFEGLPPPEAEKWPFDEGAVQFKRQELSISLDEVKANFSKLGLLDANVVFVKGFFEDSLQSAPIEKLSILRLDGDMYGSTMTVLQQLYHRLEVGGFLILDDWLLKWARRAFLDFRQEMGIREPLVQDSTGVFFRKEMETPPMSKEQALALARKSRPE